MLAFASTGTTVAGLTLLGSLLKVLWRATVLGAAVRVAALILPAFDKACTGLLSAGLGRLASATTRLAGAASAWHASACQRVDRAAAQQPRSTAKATVVDVPAEATASVPSDSGAMGAPPQDAESMRRELQGMRVKQLKAELRERGIPHADAIEKVDLVERLVSARLSSPAPPSSTSAPPSPPAATSPPEVEVVGNSNASTNPFGGFGGGSSPLDDAALGEAARQMGVDEGEARKVAEMMMSDPSAMQLMMEIQSKPRVMEALMDVAANGEAAAAKYVGDAEVMSYMQKLEQSAQQGL